MNEECLICKAPLIRPDQLLRLYTDVQHHLSGNSPCGGVSVPKVRADLLRQHVDIFFVYDSRRHDGDYL